MPLRHKEWKEGATATVSVLDRRGKRVGTVYLGRMPESGQTTLTTHLTALIQDILKQVDAQGLRLVYVSDDGYHPSDYPYSDTCRTWSSITKVYGCVRHYFPLSLATGMPRFYVCKFGQHTKVTL